MTALAARRVCRLLWVAGVLVLIAGWRIGQSVATAYRAGWVRPHACATTCAHAPRLPSDWWTIAWAASAVVSVALLLGAVWCWRRRSFATTPPSSPGLGHWTLAMALLAAGFAAGGAVARGFAASGYHPALLWVRILDLVTLLPFLGILVAHANALLAHETDSAGLRLIVGIRLFFQRHAVNAIAVGMLAFLLTAFGQTSGQAVDSLRTWTLGSGREASRLGFGLAATLLLALVTYESATMLAQTTTALAAVRTRIWIAIGIGFAVLAAIVGPTGGHVWGLLVCGGVMGVLALLDFPWRDPEPQPEAVAAAPSPLSTEGVEPIGAPGRHGELLATVPLLAVAAAALAAFVDGALSGPAQLSPLVVAVVSGGFAVLLVREQLDDELALPRARTAVAIAALVSAAGILTLAVHRSILSAVVAFAALAVLLAYAVWAFVLRPASAPARPALAGVFALAAATLALLGIHVDTFSTARTLGTFGLVEIGLAGALVLAYLAVHATLVHRPPRALAAIGMEQAPILTIVAVTWVVAGLVLPASVHDVRVLPRTPAPTVGLVGAFAAWRAAQPEMGPHAAPGDGRTIPLVLVAAHGGGIRAAYWTALALDCMVGGAARPDEPACGGERRTPAEQLRAAGRIFVASGVSGGAVGLYAYARQLLADGELTSGSGHDWIDDRLGGDFASPAIGWGLFGDLWNHYLGYRHDRAQALEDSFDRAWPAAAGTPRLRRVWDARVAGASKRARAVPLLVMNATVTGGSTRVAISGADLSAWPGLDGADTEGGTLPDPRPLAGSPDAVDALCATGDIRLSTAALLAARFPYVTPSGRIDDRCRGEHPVDASIDVVDGGYADNSGLFTLAELWPSLRRLVADFNGSDEANGYRIAPVVVEIDNHYRPPLTAGPGAGPTRQTLVPPLTAFGARHVVETYARAVAYRLAPADCVFTISPGLHPGLTAPLGWELSQEAQDELRAGIRGLHASVEAPDEVDTARAELRRLQQLLGPHPDATGCVPR